MKNTQLKFLQAVALKRPYSFGETGLTTDKDGSITLSTFEAQSIGRNVAILSGVMLLVGVYGGKLLSSRKRP